MNQSRMFANKYLGRIHVKNTGNEWNAVQISEDTVRCARGMDSFFISLSHFKTAIQEGRYVEMAL
jgi:hypothetical protein